MSSSVPNAKDLSVSIPGLPLPLVSHSRGLTSENLVVVISVN